MKNLILKLQSLERHTWSGPHRICFDGGFRGRGCRRDYAGRCTSISTIFSKIASVMTAAASQGS